MARRLFLNERRTPKSRVSNPVTRDIRDIRAANIELANRATPIMQNAAQKGITATGRAIVENERRRREEAIANARSVATGRRSGDVQGDIATQEISRQQVAASPALRGEAERQRQESFDVVRNRLRAQNEAEKAFREFDILTSAQVSHQGKTAQEVQDELDAIAERRDIAEQAFLDKQAMAIAMGAQGVDVSKGGVPAGGIRRGEKVTAEAKGQLRDIRDLTLEEQERQLEERKRSAPLDERLATQQKEAESARLGLEEESEIVKQRVATEEASLRQQRITANISNKLLQIKEKEGRGEELSDSDKQYKQIFGKAKELPKQIVRKFPDGTLRDLNGNILTQKPVNSYVVDVSDKGSKTVKDLKGEIEKNKANVIKWGKELNKLNKQVEETGIDDPELRENLNVFISQARNNILSAENVLAGGTGEPTATVESDITTPKPFKGDIGIGTTQALSEFNLGEEGVRTILGASQAFDNVVGGFSEQDQVELGNIMRANNLKMDLGMGLGRDEEGNIVTLEATDTTVTPAEVLAILRGDVGALSDVVARAELGEGERRAAAGTALAEAATTLPSGLAQDNLTA